MVKIFQWRSITPEHSNTRLSSDHNGFHDLRLLTILGKQRSEYDPEQNSLNENASPCPFVLD